MNLEQVNETETKKSIYLIFVLSLRGNEPARKQALNMFPISLIFFASEPA